MGSAKVAAPKTRASLAISELRPISLTCVMCRVFERIISVKLMEHLLFNNLASSNQFGFLPNHSSRTQLFLCLKQNVLCF